MHNFLIMKHIPNENLSEGTYRIVCLSCSKVFAEGNGDYSHASHEAMRYSDICDECNGEVILETNPIPRQNAYDAEHPYPQF